MKNNKYKRKKITKNMACILCLFFIKKGKNMYSDAIKKELMCEECFLKNQKQGSFFEKE